MVIVVAVANPGDDGWNYVILADVRELCLIL